MNIASEVGVPVDKTILWSFNKFCKNFSTPVTKFEAMTLFKTNSENLLINFSNSLSDSLIFKKFSC